MRVVIPPGVRDLLVRRRALALTLVSLVAWGTWNLVRDAGHPYGDLFAGSRTDHFSHMNTARLFTVVGLDIWRKPLRDSVTPLTPEQKARMPADIQPALGGRGEVFAVPGWPVDKPFISSWSHNPRFHPPGNMVLTAPVALLYSYTGLSFTWANKLLILLFLVYAHIALYLFFQSGLGFDRFKPVGFLILAAVYFEIIQRTLEGFYEAAAVVPLILCGRYAQQRKGIYAITAFTVAANIHFRSFFFAPLLFYAVALTINEAQWKDWKRKEYVLAGVSLVLGLISLGVFRLVWPFLRSMPQGNPLNITADPVNVPAVATLVLIIGIIIGVLLYARAWLDAILAGWFAIMIVFLREVYAWDVLSLLAWVGMPVIVAAATHWRLVRDVRFAGLVFIAAFVFHNGSLLNPGWLQRVFAG